MRYKLLRAERLPTGSVRHHIILPGDIESIEKYFDVRMAITPPGGENNGYFIVAGELWFDLEMYPDSRGDICVFHEYEHEELSLDSFFRKATDAYLAYCCSVIYLDTETYVDFVERFYDFTDEQNIQEINIEPAPYIDFYLGAALIIDAGKKGILDIPKDFLVKSELDQFTRKDLDNNPEINFPRINALRFLIGGFDKYPPSSQPHSLPMKQVEYGKDGWLAR